MWMDLDSALDNTCIMCNGTPVTVEGIPLKKRHFFSPCSHGDEVLFLEFFEFLR